MDLKASYWLEFDWNYLIEILKILIEIWLKLGFHHTYFCSYFVLYFFMYLLMFIANCYSLMYSANICSLSVSHVRRNVRVTD